MKRLALLVLIVAIMVTLIPGAAQAQPTEGRQCRTIHIVRRGQTLSMIAARYGVSTKTLQRANNIRNRNIIYVGQRICIPGKKAPHPYPPPPSGACIYHIVRPGQSLTGIANWYGVNVNALARRNGISNPSTIYPGQRLVIRCTSEPPPPPPGQPPYYPPPPGPIPPPPGYSCQILPVQGFGQLWYNNQNVRQRLGCPTAVETGFPAIYEPFAYGHVIEDTGSKTIYVFFPRNGVWAQHPDTWQEGEPVMDPNLVPPYGWYQPTYGIGKMWRTVDNYTQLLGWAKQPAYPTNATRQTYQNGTMIWTANDGAIRVMYNNGTFQRFP